MNLSGLPEATARAHHGVRIWRIAYRQRDYLNWVLKASLAEGVAPEHVAAPEALCEQFDAKPAEIRMLLHGSLDPGRTAEVTDEMRAAGLPSERLTNRASDAGDLASVSLIVRRK